MQDNRVCATRVLEAVVERAEKVKDVNRKKHRQLVDRANWLLTTFEDVEQIPLRIECIHYAPMIPVLNLPWTYTITLFALEDSWMVIAAFNEVLREVNLKDPENEFFLGGAYIQDGKGYILLNIRPKL